MSSKMSHRIQGSYNRDLYPYKNDPKPLKRNLYVTNVNDYSGGYIPILDDQNYTQRKQNVMHSYTYDDRTHRGTRPMHQSSFDLNYQPKASTYVTNNMLTYRGGQLDREHQPQPAPNQFRHQFEFGSDNKRHFVTHYESNFYPKSDDREYRSNFEILPKYRESQEYHESRKQTDERIKANKMSLNLGDDKNEPGNYFTQYKRTHDYLGQLRGPGEPRDYPDRRAYNVLNWEEAEKPGWSNNDSYKRVSGNVVLGNVRNNQQNLNQSILN